ncbi:MAG: hypothetical protein LAT63_01120 [Marinobacter sp.]|nr:hypothetical protein [Marinobacter sp.]
MDEKPGALGVSATEWRHMYFAGVTRLPVNEINLTDAQMGGLLSMVGLNAVVASGAAIEPQYLINQKGTTPWLAMHVLLHVKNPDALDHVASGRLRAHIPPDSIRGAFGTHINWPAELLDKYDLGLGEYRLFSIPFLVHSSVPQIGSLTESMKAPDGSLEVFGLYEFDAGDPEGLLKDLSELANFIKTNRADAIH